MISAAGVRTATRRTMETAQTRAETALVLNIKVGMITTTNPESRGETSGTVIRWARRGCSGPRASSPNATRISRRVVGVFCGLGHVIPPAGGKTPAGGAELAARWDVVGDGAEAGIG